MAVTFIGDVHGWSRRLEAVLAQAEGDIVLMGDLIDRGPEVPAVLDRVRGGCEAGRMRCLLGNHEFALLRGLGAPTLGLDPDAHWFEMWRDRHGGKVVMDSYHAGDARSLRRAMGTDLIAWLASLPWCLEADGWIAVHAGMRPDQPLDVQLEMLRDGWRHLLEQPDHLYDKAHVREAPDDLPDGCVLVSGHLPLPEVLLSPRRILCDTTGGMPGRRLSGVIWPDRRIITS